MYFLLTFETAPFFYEHPVLYAINIYTLRYFATITSYITSAVMLVTNFGGAQFESRLS
jgi:hypothetical protein